MLETLLKAGASFDWISPLVATVQDLVNGPSRTFLIPTGCGWSGHEIIRLLRSRGVKTWGHMVVNDTIMISVRASQARWAEYLLERAGILAGAGLPGTAESRASGSVASSARGGLADSFETVIGEIADLLHL